MDNLTLCIVFLLLGMALLFAEVFVPSFGILSALSLTSFVVGVVCAFNVNTTTGYISLAVVFVTLPLFALFVFKIWPNTPLGRRMFLRNAQEEEPFSSKVLAGEMQQYVGQTGQTLSPLRPAGVTDFNGRRIDTMSEGSLIDSGVWVKCIAVRDGRVIVREVESPPDLADLESMSLD